MSRIPHYPFIRDFFKFSGGLRLGTITAGFYARTAIIGLFTPLQALMASLKPGGDAFTVAPTGQGLRVLGYWLSPAWSFSYQGSVPCG
ncbi:hypothetical protein KBT16_01000 [Nostoc sp. CCCryo 231-06]|nr:hypothetical protein [Nostoc sp. CCCryo 231-06]